MFQDHYLPLVLAYLAALGGQTLADRCFPSLWPRKPAPGFERPWTEFGWAMIGAVGIIGMGQLWSSGIRLPESGAIGPLLASINQALIFAPILLVVVFRGHPWTTAWLPRPRIAARLLVGLVLAALAVTVYASLRTGASAPWTTATRIWRYENIDKLAQVFFEDLTIAILFVRLAGAVGYRGATVVVACLFAAGHVPAMVSQGASWSELAALARDAALGVAVILVLQRSRDVVWFWCIHFCLDMTQFSRISGVTGT